ncbi:MAG: hypothetical protein RI885_1844 [Actinomycetota bacterium]|jgi:aminoglycoside phosphotransferase (APT) family kinase protein
MIIDTDLVTALVAEQFPRWRHLPIRLVDHNGWDNRTFRLGDSMSVRLPSAVGYVAQVDKEQRWLPVLAPRLPLQIPAPIALGRPGAGYPWPWSVYRWIEGEPATSAPSFDRRVLAGDLGDFLQALQAVDSTGGPAAGDHSAWRGAHLRVYDADTRAALEVLRGHIDVGAAATVWDAAMTSEWGGPPVWLHGDVAAGNLLLREGRLAAVIDFGCSAIGDPSCDLVVAWTLFDMQNRALFARHLSLDDGTWARARGWALWKALITAAQEIERRSEERSECWSVIDAVLEDRVQG